jgi:hypothetical protein
MSCLPSDNGMTDWRHKFGNPAEMPGSLAKTPMVRVEYYFRTLIGHACRCASADARQTTRCQRPDATARHIAKRESHTSEPLNVAFWLWTVSVLHLAI